MLGSRKTIIPARNMENMGGVTGGLTLAMLQSLDVLFQCQIDPNEAEQPSEAKPSHGSNAAFLSEATRLLESSSEVIRTLEQVNMSLREGKSLDVSVRSLEAISDLKAQLESLLQGRKWRNAVERIWAFGPRRSDSSVFLILLLCLFASDGVCELLASQHFSNVRSAGCRFCRLESCEFFLVFSVRCSRETPRRLPHCRCPCLQVRAEHPAEQRGGIPAAVGVAVSEPRRQSQRSDGAARL